MEAEQLTLDLFGTVKREPCEVPCMWLEEVDGKPFCYLNKKYRPICTGGMRWQTHSTW